MERTIANCPLWIWACLSLLGFSAIPLSAEEFGLFTYRVNSGISGDFVVITDYPETEIGHVEIPSEIDGLPVAEIARYAFGDCRDLTSITIPGSVVEIERQAFSFCSGLASITISDGVEEIGAEAFGDCYRLSDVSIPASVTDLSSRAFRYCWSLNSVSVDPANPKYSTVDGIVFADGQTELVLYPEGRPGTEYTVPSGVEIIGSYAFAGSRLVEITLPASVSQIGFSVFLASTRLGSISVNPANPSFSSIDGVLFDVTGSTLVRYPEGKDLGYTVPSGVTTIGPNAFRETNRLTSITIPASVTEIADPIFRDCSSLRSILVDPESTSFASADGALLDGARTTLIQHPRGRSGHYAIPEGVVTIADHAFSKSYRLSGVTIPNTVTSLGMYSFYFCEDLSDVFIPPSVTSIGDSAFRAVYGLRRVKLSEGLVSIGHWAFGACRQLERITIPASVNEIKSNAFRGNDSFASALFLGDAPETFFGLVFTGARFGFRIYFLSGSSGFTSPNWEGYRTVMIDEVANPAAPWLVEHGFEQDAELDSDTTGDGVPLLTAYALNLDPHLNPQRFMPVPISADGTLSMTFSASRPGITYRAETSTDLQGWGTEGVMMSEPDQDGRRTASVGLDSAFRYLRLVVGN